MSALTVTVADPKKRVYKKKPVVVVEEIFASVVDSVVDESVVVEKVVEEETVEEEEVNKVEVDKKSSVVNRESVMSSFDELIGTLDSEINTLRASDNKNKSVTFLRKVVAQLKKLQKHTARIAKGGKIRKAGTNTSSGFLKPVPVSDEIKRFAGASFPR